MTEQAIERNFDRKRFAIHGWVGIGLIIIFWVINWTFSGARTYWAFFPLWLGYCLTIDAINLLRTGTSLLSRSYQRFIGLFLVSAPVWWLFEVINWRVQSWHYLGRDLINNWQYVVVASINFSVVIPAVFGTVEFASSFRFIRKLKSWLVIRPDLPTTLPFFIAGWVMLGLLMAWPAYFFPFLWLSIYFILEPINIWSGNRALTDYTKNGDWRPILSLFLGVIITGLFWEMWNFFSYPKWVYTIQYVNYFHIFEMPILGYGGYLPFACEIFAIYNMVTGFFGLKKKYINLEGWKKYQGRLETGEEDY
jgi:hypothetical protein